MYNESKAVKLVRWVDALFSETLAGYSHLGAWFQAKLRTTLHEI